MPDIDHFVPSGTLNPQKLTPEVLPADCPEALPPEQLPNLFDVMCAKLAGTVIIHGDIVNSDPELWCDEE